MLPQKLLVLSNTIDIAFGSSQLRNIIPLSIVSLSKTDQWKDTFSPEFLRTDTEKKPLQMWTFFNVALLIYI